MIYFDSPFFQCYMEIISRVKSHTLFGLHSLLNFFGPIRQKSIAKEFQNARQKSNSIWSCLSSVGGFGIQLRTSSNMAQFPFSEKSWLYCKAGCNILSWIESNLRIYEKAVGTRPLNWEQQEKTFFNTITEGQFQKSPFCSKEATFLRGPWNYLLDLSHSQFWPIVWFETFIKGHF